jgi:pimeloyl-ACP methyl ester carboxylesterase
VLYIANDFLIEFGERVTALVRKKRTRRILKIAAVLPLLGILAFGTLLGLLWIERRTDITLPAPTGPFAVGRTTYAWRDDTKTDTLAPVSGTKREVLGWIWYPAALGQSPAVTEDYLPPPWRAAVEGTRGVVIKLLTRDLDKVHTHSIRDVGVSQQQPSYPVVIFRGGASAQVTNYSTLAEDLASYGYVVVGIDAPYRTTVVVFPDGRVIQRTPDNNPELVSGQDLIRRAGKLLTAWTADIGFVLDQLERLNAADPSGKFTGRFDLSRVGVFGHSFGGAQAAQFCHEDSRCKAAIDIDGVPLGSVVQTGLHQPFMFLFSDLGDFSSDAEIGRIQADVQSLYDRLPTDSRLRVSIRGANHFTFSDDGALLKSRVVRGLLHAFGKRFASAVFLTHILSSQLARVSRYPLPCTLRSRFSIEKR